MIEEIENILHQKIETIEPLFVGLSNDHVLINHTFFVRIEKKNGRKDVTPKEEAWIEEKYGNLFHPSFPTLFFDVDKNIKISLYQPHFEEFSSLNATKEQLKQIATLLKRLHALKEGKDHLSSFEPLKRMHYYRNEAQVEPHPLEKDIEENYTKYDQDLVICHHDVVPGNLLIKDGHIELIDFEYVGLDDPYFDLASFISENNIRDQQMIFFFLASYFLRKPQEKEIEKFAYYLKLNDLLWYYWALMMERKTHQEIFQEIAKEKEEHLRSPFL